MNDFTVSKVSAFLLRTNKNLFRLSGDEYEGW